MKNEEKRLLDLADRLELPEEALGGLKLSVTCARRALVENHHGVLEYSGEQIVVSAGRGRLALRGSGLCLEAMNRNELLITGKIESAEWEGV